MTRISLDYQSYMTSKLRFEPKALKSALLSKGALLLVMLDRRVHIKVFEMFRKNFEQLNTTAVYHLSIQT